MIWPLSAGLLILNSLETLRVGAAPKAANMPENSGMAVLSGLPISASAACLKCPRDIIGVIDNAVFINPDNAR